MICVNEECFDAGVLTEQLRTKDNQCGALVSFIGSVRDINEGQDVIGLSLEHYPGMTEKVLSNIAESAKARFGVKHISIYHRVGRLDLNDPIVYVGVAAQHRENAFLACEFIMDFLKNDAPFWKKEHRKSGSVWLDPAQKEHQAKQRWS
jgi:molybdopterin synthase catalytic subunit